MTSFLALSREQLWSKGPICTGKTHLEVVHRLHPLLLPRPHHHTLLLLPGIHRHHYDLDHNHRLQRHDRSNQGRPEVDELARRRHHVVDDPGRPIAALPRLHE